MPTPANCSTSRPIQIVGGGLAGLSLGIALARRGIPTSLREAATYPRHKVCGEFIAGLEPETIETLGIATTLEDAEMHSRVAWYRQGKRFRSDRLPRPAYGISRHRLDQRLAEAFRNSGGTLLVASRFPADPNADFPEGLVWAIGRKRARSDWMGIKLHCRNLYLNADLEVHLGDQAYAGASAVEDGRVNVCALIKRRPGMLGDDREAAFFDCLAAAGLGELAARAREGDPDLASQTSVAGLGFGYAKPETTALRIGDAYALIPPFTGDGMAMAFEAAAAAVDPLVRYAEHRISWTEATRQTQRKLQKLFRTRLAAAQALHGFLLKPGRQRVFQTASAARLLPFQPLFQLLHSFSG